MVFDIFSHEVCVYTIFVCVYTICITVLGCMTVFIRESNSDKSLLCRSKYYLEE